MSSIKSFFDSQCGTQAPIVSLSKNFSQSNFLLPSTHFRPYFDSNLVFFDSYLIAI